MQVAGGIPQQMPRQQRAVGAALAGVRRVPRQQHAVGVAVVGQQQQQQRAGGAQQYLAPYQRPSAVSTLTPMFSVGLVIADVNSLSFQRRTVPARTPRPAALAAAQPPTNDFPLDAIFEQMENSSNN